jgi:hypothetical protein
VSAANFLSPDSRLIGVLHFTRFHGILAS